jgi:HAE1 family hydrophobic/amphiphilic exporter-1
MFISDFAIKRPLITIVSMVALVVFGLFALWQLETDEFPDVQQPIINVAIPYPGASPDVVEREVLDRGTGWLRQRHRLLRLREGSPAGVAGYP